MFNSNVSPEPYSDKRVYGQKISISAQPLRLLYTKILASVAAFTIEHNLFTFNNLNLLGIFFVTGL